MNLDTGILLQILTLAAMVIGLFGLVIPIFPGLVVIWASALGYGVLAGFQGGWVVLGIMTVLMLVGSIIDNVFIGAKAIQQGGSVWTVVIASVAGLVGSLLLPPVGGLIGALGGAFLFEYARHKDEKKALELTKGMAIGCGWAFVTRFLIGVVMIGLWLIWAF